MSYFRGTSSYFSALTGPTLSASIDLSDIKRNDARPSFDVRLRHDRNYYAVTARMTAGLFQDRGGAFFHFGNNGENRWTTETSETA